LETLVAGRKADSLEGPQSRMSRSAGSDRRNRSPLRHDQFAGIAPLAVWTHPAKSIRSLKVDFAKSYHIQLLQHLLKRVNCLLFAVQN